MQASGASGSPTNETNRHAQLAAWFDELCHLDAEQRAPRLRAIEELDATAAAELRSLLDADSNSARALEQPAAVALTESLRGPELPERLGHFRVLGELGRGGMGVVLLAEQERPRRVVALKLLRHGLLSANRVARFEREADVLARLDHQGIARVLEVGTLDVDGEPRAYIAMEHVEGLRLDDWVRQASPSRRERIEVLVQIAEAVGQCHANGIVHRDVKPANVMIDSHGQAKVLDFGVARVLDDREGAATAMTSTGEIVGTLHTMSPEQVRGDGSSVDARSDVYALGVLGYELLCGVLPYDTRGLAMHEAARVIVETEPLGLGRRDSKLAGDVETIVAKALEKEPRRRYASATELARDLTRFLEDRPIEARPMTRSYRAVKYVRRNRAFVGAMAAIMAALVLGMVGTTWQARSARMAAQQADERLARAVEVSRLIEGIFGSIDPELEGRDARVFDMLERSEQFMLPAAESGEGRSPLVVASLHHAIGSAYLSLKSGGDAGRHLRRAVELRREHGEEAWALAESLEALVDLNTTNLGESKGDARALLMEALSLRRELGGAESVAALRDELRLLQMDWNERPESSHADDVLALQSRFEASLPNGGRELDAVRLQLAKLLRETGQLVAAEELLVEVRDSSIDALGPDHLVVVDARKKLAEHYIFIGQFEAAKREIHAALEVAGDKYDEHHPDLAFIHRRLGEIEIANGRADAAIPHYEQFVASIRAIQREPSVLLAKAILALGQAKLQVGNVDEARVLIEEANTLATPELGLTVQERADFLEAMGLLSSWEGSLEGALKHQRAANELRLANGQPPGVELAGGLFNEGTILRRIGRNEEALPLLLDAFEMENEFRGTESHQSMLCRFDIGSVYLHLDRAEEAAEYLGPCATYFREAHGEGSSSYFMAMREWCMALIQLGRGADGLEVLEGVSEEALFNDVRRDLYEYMLARCFELEGQRERALGLIQPFVDGSRGQEGHPDSFAVLTRECYERLTAD